MPSATDVFARASSGTRPTPTTLTAILASGSSPGTATCAALTGWPTTSKVHFCIYTINTSGAKVAGSQTDWVGVVSGSTITGLTLKAGTNVGYSVGAVVEASPIAAYADDLFSGLTAQHSAVDGSHTAITATSLSTSAAVTVGSGLTVTAGSVSLPASSISGAALASYRVLRQNDTTNSTETAARILTGWGVIAYNTGANNVSESVTFNGTFTSIPIVTLTFGGDHATLTTLGSGGNNVEAFIIAKAHSVTTSGFTAFLGKTGGVNLGAGNGFYHWTAIGT